MICDWCGGEIPDLGKHFQSWVGKPCRIAALAHQRPEPRVTKLDGNLTGEQIRRRSLRELHRNRKRDRLEEPGVATYARHDRQGRT